MTIVKVEDQVAQPHDVGYKHLLSSKPVFLELLKSFIKANWVTEIDEESLEQMEGSFITPDFHSKECDFSIESNLRIVKYLFIYC